MTGRNEPRELLYGLIALQMGVLGRQALIGAVELWLNELDMERLQASGARRDLRTILREQGLVTGDAEEAAAAAVEAISETGPGNGERGGAIRA
ncbi:MAG: hypothetical protein HYY18_05965 [Planctomycetes bacterium]|nr:hypothetical protein [Planctomycetota bacterium]